MKNIPLQKALKDMCEHPLKGFQFLRDRKILTPHNLPHSFFISEGLLATTDSRWLHPVLGMQHNRKTVVTPKGMHWLYDRLREAPQTVGLGTIKPPKQRAPEESPKSRSSRVAAACSGTHASHSQQAD